MTKRSISIAAAVLALMLLLTQTGCSTVNQIMDGGNAESIFSAVEADLFGEGSQSYSTITVTLPRHSGYQPIEDKTAYATLKSEEQREAYKAIEESLFCLTSETGGDYGRYCMKSAMIPTMSSGEIFMVKEAVMSDHPEAFWINSTYSLGYNLHDGNSLVMYSNFDYTTIVTRLKALEQAVSTLLKQLPSNLSELEREIIIHDCLVRDTEYDTQSAELSSANYVDAGTVYGTLVNKRALCGGYSMAAKLLLNRVGISCSTVKGISKDVGHMWNVVRIDGEWYHMDITWDDPVSLSSESVMKYDYFNITDKQIQTDHVISDNYSALTEALIQQQDGKGMNFFNFDMPTCTAEAANYYRLYAIRVSELGESGRSAITNRMVTLSLSGEDTFYIMFPEDMETEVTSEWLDRNLGEAMAGSNRITLAEGGRRIVQCVRGTKTDEAAPFLNVFYVKLIFESAE